MVDLNFKGVHFKRGSFELRIETLSLTGPLVVLVGPNGSGKTTLLHLALELLKPQEGSISYGFKDLTLPYFRDKVSFALRHPYLPSTMSWREIEQTCCLAESEGMMLSLRRRAQKQFGLNAFIDMPLGKLSSGMLQKVNILQTLLGNPEVLFYDEPESHLDQTSLEQVAVIFGELIKMDKLVVMHNIKYKIGLQHMVVIKIWHIIHLLYILGSSNTFSIVINVFITFCL
jgi:ABC-type multidrug transport system ATPase subunit